MRIMRRGIVLVAAGLAAMSVTDATGAPKPASVSPAWQLDFEFHDPARISVNLPGDYAPTTAWYLLYSVTNNTGEEIDFYPSFDLVTDTLEVVEGDAGIHPDIHRAVQKRHGKQYPFFSRPDQVLGTLHQGEDYTRTAAVAFRDFDPDASSFTIYIGGLSGEMTRVGNPSFDPSAPESDKNPRYRVLRKTLAVTYELPGDRVSRNLADPVRIERKWVMR